MNEEKETKRKRAGRPKLDPSIRREAKTVSMPTRIFDRLDAMKGSRGELIEAALIKFYNWSK